MRALVPARWWWSCHQDNPRSGGRGRFSYGGYNLALPLHVAARTVGCVDNRSEIRDFLATRRAKLTPGQVGLPTSGRRRVPGLRREEVAVLAGVSPDWYARLEKGHIAGVSDDVLDAVARALHSCTLRLPANRTTGRCVSSSASCRRSATCFAGNGQRTTSASVTTASSGSATQRSAT